MTLEADHINEDCTDDRRENLQFMCPNCHTQKTVNEKSAELRRAAKITWESRDRNAPTVSTDPQLRLALEPILTARTGSVKGRSKQRKILWPTPECLTEMLRVSPVRHVANNLCVSDVAVLKHCKRHGIPLTGKRGYWNRRKAGLSHEEALVPIALQPKREPRFSPEELIEIKRLLVEDNLSLRAIADRFGACHQTIMRIRDGTTHRDKILG
jgi:hypothetical protein